MNEEYRCSLRGKLKKEFEFKGNKLTAVDIVTVGDNVEFDLNRDGSGVITHIEKRSNYISRKAPKIKGAGIRGERLEQIVAANFNNLVIVSSAASPKFNNKLIDRLIVAGESSHVDVTIVVNKIDLDESVHKSYVQLYRRIGYQVFETSVKKEIEIEELRYHLQGKINLFWGQSGVGKSSLLNLLFPGLKLKIGEISDYTSKGKHTTVTVLLKKVDANTIVIDTPGIREIDPYGITKHDLGHYFKDFSQYITKCKFNTCTHHHEPGCGVIKAVEEGGINVERYESYLKILDTIEEDLFF